MRIVLILLLFISTAFNQVIIRPAGNVATSGGSGSSYTVEDDFSTNTSANYTGIKDGFTWDTGNGYIYGSNDWATNWSYHTTSMGSNDHTVEARLRSVGSYRAGVVLRCNGTTGYIVYLSSTNDRVYLLSFNGTTATEITNATATSAITDDAETWIKVVISGTSIGVYVDINDDGDYDDAGETVAGWTDATYSTGQYIGVYCSLDDAPAPYITDLRGF